MTTATREAIEVKSPATVLRRVECDERDAAILCAVLRGVNTYRAMREVTGCSLSGLYYRILGRDSYDSTAPNPGLVSRGLLCSDEQRFRTLRPGPRLAGIDHGWPLELVEVEV